MSWKALRLLLCPPSAIRSRTWRPGRQSGEVRIIEAEWQALYLASRTLREVGAGLTRLGAGNLAAESYLNATTLERLGRRAVVEATRDPQRSAEREAER